MSLKELAEAARPLLPGMDDAIAVAGFASLCIGVAMIYVPAALIVGGTLMMGASYLHARAKP